MEIQNAVNPGNAGASNPVLGGNGLTGKSSGGSAAEMRSAFDAMMGALLGMLNPAPPATLAPPATGDGSPAASQPVGELASAALSLESLFAQVNGKSAPASQALLAGPPAEGSGSAQPAPSTGVAAPQEGTATPTAGSVPLPLPQQTAQAGEAISPPVSADIPTGAAAGLNGQFLAAQMEAPDESGQPSDSRSPSPTPGPAFSSALGMAGESSAAAKSAAPRATQTPAIAPTPPEQIGEQVRVSLGRGEQDATLQLNPKELGSVRIRLQMENGQLHLSIRAELAETGRLLDGKLAELRQSLENQGIKVGDLAVTRSERTVSGDGLGREVAPAARSGQMDMNANDSSSQRQPAAFTGGGFDGGNPAGRQHSPGQQDGQMDSPARTGRDGSGSADRRSGPDGATRPAGVDYYA